MEIGEIRTGKKNVMKPARDERWLNDIMILANSRLHDEYPLLDNPIQVWMVRTIVEVMALLDPIEAKNE